MGVPRKSRNRGGGGGGGGRRKRGGGGGAVGGVGKRVAGGHGGGDGVIKSLPGDLLVDVLGRVASSSFTDLFNAKLSCKDFLGAAEDEYIFQNISIAKFPVIHWVSPSDQVISFLNSCKDRGNPEALFRQGMIEFFSSRSTEQGLEYLKRATEKGHIEATYVYGIILLSKGGHYSQQGLELLNSVYKQRSKTQKIRDCRRRIQAIIRSMWINNSITRRHLNMACSCNNEEMSKGGRWNYEEEDDAAYCDTCRWNREIVSFCKMLHGVV